MKRTLKVIIILISAILLIAAAVFAVMLFEKKENVESENGEITDAPYPCTWQKQEDGSIEISISGQLPENSTWELQTGSDIFEASQKEGQTVFTVKPLSEGVGNLTIALREDGLPVEKGADFYFSFLIEDGKDISVAACSAGALDAGSFISENSSNAYWRESDIGGLFIYLDKTGWIAESFEGVYCTGPASEGDDMMRIEIVPMEDFTEGNLVVFNSDTCEELTFSFVISEDATQVSGCVSTIRDVTEEEDEPLSEAELAFAEAYQAAATDEEKQQILEEYLGGSDDTNEEQKLSDFIENFSLFDGEEMTENEIKDLYEKSKNLLGIN